MRHLLAGVLTAGVLAAMLFMAWSRGTVTVALREPRGIEARDEARAGPAEEAVVELLKSGEAGDVSAYLASFSGPLRARLEREVAGRGREAFADDLRRAAAARKSHAVFSAEPDGEDTARVAVETVYPDRNERQTYRVEKTGDGWRVADVASVKSRQPAARFGTQASAIAPEGTVRSPQPPGDGLTVETGDEVDEP